MQLPPPAANQNTSAQSHSLSRSRLGKANDAAGQAGRLPARSVERETFVSASDRPPSSPGECPARPYGGRPPVELELAPAVFTCDGRPRRSIELTYVVVVVFSGSNHHHAVGGSIRAADRIERPDRLASHRHDSGRARLLFFY